jgi:hypothetical protein
MDTKAVSPSNFSQADVGAVDGGFAAPPAIGGSEANSWYAAMARAWGGALDQEAATITRMSDAVSNGGQDQPSTMTQLTAESQRMQFLSSSASTSMNSVGDALQALGKKQ